MNSSTKNNHKGGEETSSRCLNSNSNMLVYVRYNGHILFRKSNPQLYTNPNVREAIG